MENRIVAGTTLTIPRLCLGTMTFGSQVDEPTAAAMLEACLERGINFVDTANVYNGGKSEEIVGNILRGHRNQIVLASKVGIATGQGPDERGLSGAAIAKGVEDSLRRLKADYLDVYYLHQPDYATPLEESLEAIDELVRAGKVRYVGASNYAAWQLCQILWVAERGGLQPVRFVQPMYNLLSRGIEQELLPMCRQFQLTTIAYNPLAGGLLTGKHPRQAWLPGTRFEGSEAYRNRYWHEANFAAIDALRQTAEGLNCSLAAFSLRWLLYHTSVDCVILGASSREQLLENLNAADSGPLPAEAVESCDAQWQALRGPVPQYNR